MEITIASLEPMFGDILVTYNKVGNKYYTAIWHKVHKESTCQEPTTKEKAKRAFEKLTDAILDGNYSYEDRKAMLFTP